MFNIKYKARDRTLVLNNNKGEELIKRIKVEII
jgi:hypothetical protein